MSLDLAKWSENADSYPVVLYVASPDGEIRWVNNQWQRLTGSYDPAPLQHGTAGEWLEAVRSGSSFSRELRVRVADGNYRWLLSRAEPVRLPGGTVTHWLGVVLDIEDLKEVERALLKSELKFRALADNIDPIVCVFDRSWQPLYFNLRWTEFTGIAAEDALHDGWERPFKPADLPFVRAGLRAGEQTGSLSFIHELYHAPSNSYRWVHLRAHRVLDGVGESMQWFATFTDIHDAKMSMERKDRVIDTFQHALLPRQTVPVPNTGCSSVYVAATEESRVGGDWYDCFEIDERHFGVSIGDVVGHGIAASAAMARIRQYLSATAEDECEPGTILRRCNAFVWRRKLPLTTAICGVLDLENRTFEFASAGHPGVLVVREDGVEIALAPGVPLGVERASEYEPRKIPLDGVKLLVFYTDGVIEFSREVLETEQRLLANALDVARLENPASRATEIVKRTLNGSRPSDDVAMLVLSFVDGPGAMVSHRMSPYVMSWQFDSHEAEAAHRVRDQILAFLRELSIPGSNLNDAKAVLGELIANVVEHAPGPVNVEIDWRKERPLLRMRDYGPGFTLRVALPQDLLSESGRGLYLVTSLSDGLRAVSHFEGGTEVSAHLRLHKRTLE